MAVDYFLIDGPHTVPQEFAAWEQAKEQHYAIFLQAIAADPNSEAGRALDLQGEKAAAEVSRLERIAREAWARTPLFPAAVQAGRDAFYGIAAALADHHTHGKSRPNKPSCPYRIEEKIEAWEQGYKEAHDDFCKEFFDRDNQGDT